MTVSAVDWTWKPRSAVPSSLDALRAQLESALQDAKARRLRDLIDRYDALRSVAPHWTPIAVSDGFREFGAALERAGLAHLGAVAVETADVLEDWLRDSDEASS